MIRIPSISRGEHRWRDDEGAALPAAIIFSAAAFVLAAVVASTVMYSFSFTSSTRAGVQAQAAAEAGIAVARAGLLNGDCASVGGLFESESEPRYSAQVFRPAGGGWEAGCPGIATEARIVSTGTAATPGSGGDEAQDRMTVETVLAAVEGESELEATGPAIFAYDASGFGGSGTLISLDGENADVMLHTGDVHCDGGSSGAANVVIKSGNFTSEGSCRIAGDLWVNGNVSISGGAKVGGTITATSFSITNGEVGGNVWSDGALNVGNGTIGGWASGNSLSIGGGSVGAAWARSGSATVSGGTVRSTLTANGPALLTGGTFAGGAGVVAAGNVSSSISVPGGIRSGGSVTVSNGTVSNGVTAVGGVTLTGGTINGGTTGGGDVSVSNGTANGGVTTAGAVTLTGGEMKSPVAASALTIRNWPTFGGGQIAGPGCFSGTGTVGRTVVQSVLSTGGCAARGNPEWWWNQHGPITTGSAARPSAPSAPVLAVSPSKPPSRVVPEWVDFGSEPQHYNSAWGGFVPYVMGSTCTAAEFYIALQSIGDAPGVIDARACSGGISFTASGNEYTGPFDWGDDLTRNGFTLRGDLAIIAHRFHLGGSARFSGGAEERKLWLINPDATPNSVPDCGGQELRVEGGFQFDDVSTMIYTPCHVTIHSSTELTGQIFAGNVTVAGGSQITYAPLGLPGFDLDVGAPTGSVATEWDREIVSQRNISAGEG